jgi:two-component system, NarL family, response regulator YdfI
MRDKTIKKILIAEDEDLQRQYFKRDIENFRSGIYKIIGEAKTGVELIKLWKELKPDIIIADLHLPLLSGHDAIEEIRRSDTDTTIIVLTHIESKDAIESLYPLVDTYLIKSKETPDKLLKKIDLIAKYKSPVFQRYILDIIKEKSPKNNKFSFREYEVCALLKKALTNKEIADRLNISIKTIEKDIQKLFKKFNAKNRVDLINKLNENELI